MKNCGVALILASLAATGRAAEFARASSPINFLGSGASPSTQVQSFFVPGAPLRIATSGILLTMGRPKSDFFSAPSAASAAPLASFQGFDGQFGVPDTMGAAGPNHLMIALNGTFRVQTRAGAAVATLDDSTFWSTGGHLYHYDPRVVYDSSRDRWVIVEAYRNDVEIDAGISIAVSRNGDPAGWWDRYSFRAFDGEWIDYPMVGFNQLSVSVAASSIPRTGGAGHVVVYVFDKDSLYGGGNSIKADFIRRSSGLVTPVTVYGSDTTAYFVETLQFQNSVRILKQTAGMLQEVATVAGPSAWSEYTPLLPQLGSTVTISPEDTRVTNAVLRNGVIWFAQTVFLPASDAKRAAIQWWKVSPTGQLLDFGRLDDATGAMSYCFPSIAVNRVDDVAIGFAQFSASMYPAGGYALRAASDPAGTFRSPQILKSGDAPYGDPRWGDYSATVVDPDDMTFWTIQEYAASQSIGPHWGVWWGHLPNPEHSATEPQTCTSYVIAPASTNASSSAGSQIVTITGAPTGCAFGSWTMGPNDPWLSSLVNSPRPWIGSATATISWATNNGGARTGTVGIAGNTFTVNQAGAGSVTQTCTSYTITPTSTNASSSAGSQIVTITGAPTGCAFGSWTMGPNDPWLSSLVNSPRPWIGSATATISWATNNGGARTGTVGIAGNTFTVNQAASGASRRRSVRSS